MDRQKAVEARGFPYYPQSSDALAWRRCVVAAASVCGRRHEALVKWRQKRKTRPGGQPDGSSYMGAWGGWALAPNTASMGRDYRSHLHRSREGSRTFKALSIFLTFAAGYFEQENLLRGGFGGVIDRLAGRHGGRRLVQPPGRGGILRVRSAFGGGRV